MLQYAVVETNTATRAPATEIRHLAHKVGSKVQTARHLYLRKEEPKSLDGLASWWGEVTLLGVKTIPKLTSGGVRINAMQDGNLVLNTGTDYALGDEDALVQDLIKFAKADKVKINAFVPSAKKGPYSPAQVSKFAENLDPVLLVSFKPGFPAPYLAFFEPRDENTPTFTPRAKKPSKYARK